MYNSYAVDSIKELLTEASENSDYQIIYFHGGEEAIHVPEIMEKTGLPRI